MRTSRSISGEATRVSSSSVDAVDTVDAADGPSFERDCDLRRCGERGAELEELIRRAL